MSSAGKGLFVIGVTGNIACGKSTVMNELSRLGAVTIDADQVYHQMIEPETELWQALVDHFGPEITGAEGHIDRRKLGRIVFGDPARLAELEQLTHPAIRSELRRMIGEHASGVIAPRIGTSSPSTIRDGHETEWTPRGSGAATNVRRRFPARASSSAESPQPATTSSPMSG